MGVRVWAGGFEKGNCGGNNGGIGGGKLGSGDKSPSLVQCTCSLVGKKV